MAHALRNTGLGLILPALLLAGLLGLVGFQTGLIGLQARPGMAVAAPPTVTIPPRDHQYRATGTFQLHNGRTIDGPMVQVPAGAALTIMAHQVTAGDYARCVMAGACKPAQQRAPTPDHPVTGVSFSDASDYARWLSTATGATWRLPTVAEWTFAAAEKAADPAIGADGESANPADAWLGYYEREAALARGETGDPGPVGSHGINSLGVADLAGPVWEWTATCDSRTTLDAAGGIVSHLDSCGVRLLEGRHRAAMSSFIRDARSGGCSTGKPPEALGIRLVREPTLLDTLFGGFRSLFQQA